MATTGDDPPPLSPITPLGIVADAASVSSSSRRLSSPLSTRRSLASGPPKLGDFSRLGLSDAVSSGARTPPISTPSSPFWSPQAASSHLKSHHEASTPRASSLASDKGTSLGDFSRLFTMSRPGSQLENKLTPPPSSTFRPSILARPQHVPTRSQKALLPITPPQTHRSLPDDEILNTSGNPNTDSENLVDSDVPDPSSTPPTPPAFSSNDDDESGVDKDNAAGSVDACADYSIKKSSQAKKKAILAYHNPRPNRDKLGPLHYVYDAVRSEDETHQTLADTLIPLRVLDAEMKLRFPNVACEGVHVFVDMSNINISFHDTLRNKYGLNKAARFYPLPNLNLAFLTEILVRDRRVRVLNAGCSVIPGRSHPPAFVKTLLRLGYKVDCRERRVAPGGSGGEGMAGHYGNASGLSSSDERDFGRARYVEDGVDETLHTRMAESVMEYHDTPGTLVMATGDAKAAKYSDGFFAYARRALKMGWNVEVVSWKSSLSNAWRSPDVAQAWGSQLRVIELDEFLDELLLT